MTAFSFVCVCLDIDMVKDKDCLAKWLTKLKWYVRVGCDLGF